MSEAFCWLYFWVLTHCIQILLSRKGICHLTVHYTRWLSLFLTIEVQQKRGDLSPSYSVGKGRKRREHQGSVCQPWQKDVSHRKQSLLRVQKPIAVHPRISIFIPGVTAVGYLWCCPPWQTPWVWLLSLCVHPFSKEKGHFKHIKTKQKNPKSLSTLSSN